MKCIECKYLEATAEDALRGFGVCTIKLPRWIPMPTLRDTCVDVTDECDLGVKPPPPVFVTSSTFSKPKHHPV